MDILTRSLSQEKDSMEAIDWEAVYHQELPRIYNFFRYRVGDGHQAEDLTATTFEKAWRSRWRYKKNLAAFSTWLFTIARNVATDHFRHVHQEYSIEDIHRQADLVLVEETIQRKQEFMRLLKLLVKLPGREQELIALKFGAELNNREIALQTHLSESNVGTLLNRIIKKLRSEWEVENER
ncbi:MAG: sigma-70 family RNA polymerase sigma factor [Chloroflexota bacterium]